MLYRDIAKSVPINFECVVSNLPLQMISSFCCLHSPPKFVESIDIIDVVLVISRSVYYLLSVVSVFHKALRVGLSVMS